jgi:hypothetical protein
MTTYYLGNLASGALVSRASTRSDHTHAATVAGYRPGMKPIPSFSTSAAAAAKLAKTKFRAGTVLEVVEVRQVSESDYWSAVQRAKALR